MARNYSCISLTTLWKGLQGREQASTLMEKRPPNLLPTAVQRHRITDSGSSQTPNIQPTEMGPHPKHRSQMGHPAPLLPAPFGCSSLPITVGRAPPLANHLLTTTPAPLPHVSQPWGLSLDGGGFRGRILNCIAQLSDLQSLLLAPTIPFPYSTTAGAVPSLAPPMLCLPLGHLMAKGYWKV